MTLINWQSKTSDTTRLLSSGHGGTGAGVRESVVGSSGGVGFGGGICTGGGAVSIQYLTGEHPS